MKKNFKAAMKIGRLPIEHVIVKITENMARIKRVEQFGFIDCRTGNIINPIYMISYEIFRRTRSVQNKRVLKNVFKA